MSDEGLINLEDDGPALSAPEPVAPPPPAEPEPQATAQTPEPEPEQQLDAQGLLAALRQERQARKELSAQAQRASELEAQLRARWCRWS